MQISGTGVHCPLGMTREWTPPLSPCYDRCRELWRRPVASVKANTARLMIVRGVMDRSLITLTIVLPNRLVIGCISNDRWNNHMLVLSEWTKCQTQEMKCWMYVSVRWETLTFSSRSRQYTRQSLYWSKYLISQSCGSNPVHSGV